VAGRGSGATSPWDGVDVERVLAALRALATEVARPLRRARDEAAGARQPARFAEEPA